jgi:hypothetical protein
MTTLSAELVAHPSSPCDAIRRLEAGFETAKLPGELEIRFRMDGDIGRIRLPPAELARRRDGLWQHTCFEVFLRPDGSDSYHEFNFAPSGDWAAYRFGGRRSDSTAPELAAPRIECRRLPDGCTLSAQIAIAALPELARAASIDAGLTAVIETIDGARSYWALAHGGDKPDFHDPATFTLRVPPR